VPSSPQPNPHPALLQVQLLLGRLPSPALIAAHGLHQYEPIIAAMRSGDVKLFNDTMDAQQFRFIQEVRCWGCVGRDVPLCANTIWLRVVGVGGSGPILQRRQQLMTASSSSPINTHPPIPAGHLPAAGEAAVRSVPPSAAQGACCAR
jgi:hypothetical protein